MGLAGTLHLMLSEAKIDFDVCTEGRPIDLVWRQVGGGESDKNSSLDTGSAGHWTLLTFPFCVGFVSIVLTPELLWKSPPDFLAVNKKYRATETKISSNLARLLSSWWFFMSPGVCRHLVTCVRLDSKSVKVRRWVGPDFARYCSSGRGRRLRHKEWLWREGIWLSISRIQVLQLFDNVWSQGEKFHKCTCSQSTSEDSTKLVLLSMNY